MTISHFSDLLQIEDKVERRVAYFAFVAESENRTDNLQNRISAGVALSVPEIESLMSVLGKHCRTRTKGRLAMALSCVPDIPSYSIFERVIVRENGSAGFVAGQDYTTELPLARKCLIESRPLG